jgi:hypothetical protein
MVSTPLELKINKLLTFRYAKNKNRDDQYQVDAPSKNPISCEN